jgi:hypothetical protein
MDDSHFMEKLHQLHAQWKAGELTEDELANCCTWAADSWARNAVMRTLIEEGKA